MISNETIAKFLDVCAEKIADRTLECADSSRNWWFLAFTFCASKIRDGVPVPEHYRNALDQCADMVVDGRMSHPCEAWDPAQARSYFLLASDLISSDAEDQAA